VNIEKQAVVVLCWCMRHYPLLACLLCIVVWRDGTYFLLFTGEAKRGARRLRLGAARFASRETRIHCATYRSVRGDAQLIFFVLIKLLR